MYLGVANYTAQFRRPWWYFRRQEYAPYFQDNWKITPRLTLNLGLRYEYRTPLYDRHNTQLSFDFDKRAYVIGTDYDRISQARRHAAFDRARNQQLRRQDHHLQGSRTAAGIWFTTTGRTSVRGSALPIARSTARTSFVIRGGYRISYYTQPIQAFRLQPEQLRAGGRKLPEQRDQHRALAGRAPQLRASQRAVGDRRREQRRFDHQHRRHAHAGARLLGSVPRSASSRTRACRTGTSRSRRKWARTWW